MRLGQGWKAWSLQSRVGVALKTGLLRIFELFGLQIIGRAGTDSPGKIAPRAGQKEVNRERLLARWRISRAPARGGAPGGDSDCPGVAAACGSRSPCSPGDFQATSAQRLCRMRLGSGAFAACCVAIEVVGVAIFIRGFFPAPVRSSVRPEHGVETPAPEPVAGMDPLPGGPRFHSAPPRNSLHCVGCFCVIQLGGNRSRPLWYQFKPRVTPARLLVCSYALIPVSFPDNPLNHSQFRFPVLSNRF